MDFPGRPLLAALLFVVACTQVATGQDAPGSLVFRSSVDVVSLAVVVRDGKGRVVTSLGRDDFEVFDEGVRKPILALQAESAAPASVALLVDGSGSMSVGVSQQVSRTISDAILDALDRDRDDAALFSFDTRLLTLQSFTRELDIVRTRLADVGAWGETSLYDAVAGAAGIVAQRTHNRRAVIVITDGTDNASSYTPSEVSAIASSIDVPVYVFAVTASTDGGPHAQEPRGALADLARWTGGDLFVASDAVHAAQGIRRLIEELRHQYVLAFEASPSSGWRTVRLKTRTPGLTVRSRGWYLAGGLTP